MAKAKSLLDDVLTRASPNKRGTASWFDRLPADAREQLDAVRQAFKPGEHELNSYARAVMAAAQERGWQTSGIQGVIAWLRGGRR